MTFINTPDLDAAYAAILRWRAQGHRARLVATPTGRWLACCLES